jgi:hypothetical protein
MSVKDGRLVLPDGMSYRVLVLPDTPFMTPRTLARVRELVQQGATVIGPRPSKSPSLQDYPACDTTVMQIGADLWGDTDGKTVKEHPTGKGRVVVGRTPEEVLAGVGVPQDCAFDGGGMAWIHRQAAGADLYFVSNQRAESREVQCRFRVSGKTPELWHADTGQIEAAPVWSSADQITTVSAHFDPSGSVFVVFRKSPGPDHLVAFKPPPPAESAKPPKIEIRKARYEATDGSGGADVTEKVAAMLAAGQTTIPANNATYGDPTYLHVKRLRVEYTLDGKAMTKSAAENGTLELGNSGPVLPPPFTLSLTTAGAPAVNAFEGGLYEFTTASGKVSTLEVKTLPGPTPIRGPWHVAFQPGRGAPPSMTLEQLGSWTDQSDAGVKYFSGTAEYQTDFELAPEMIGPSRLLQLDLGEVGCIAEVSLNGTDLGTWWKPPFVGDISKAAKAGKNSLNVRITNLWVNRLIGDEQYPDDCEWNGKPIKQWPEWLTSGKPRPVKERVTFTTWKHYTRDSELQPSGLIGPVVVRCGVRAE